MFAKKLLLVTAAVLAVAVAASACSGGGTKGGDTYTLSSGDYDFTVADVPTNTCWPQSNPLPISLVGLSIGIEIVSTNGTSFLLLTPDTLSSFLPPVQGTINGNDLAASGTVTGYALDTAGNCVLDVTADADGELTGDDEFAATITASLTAGADCSAFVGQPIPGTQGLLPFPTLTNGSAGTCSIAIAGEAVIAE